MKTARLTISLATVALLLLCSANVWAKGPSQVKNTIHNLSSSSTSVYYKSSESEVCIFCHTPHGGSNVGPLWNRSVGVAPSGWTHYNSSTLSDEAKISLDATTGINRTVNDESLLCMACHDGGISVYHLLNYSSAGIPRNDGTTSTDVKITIKNPYPGERIGAGFGNLAGLGDLSDDHPVSFSYKNVYESFDYSDVNGAKYQQLRSPADALLGYNNDGEGVRFFGVDQRLECSSCHDPHVDYVTVANAEYAPFLIRPNTGSQLCLTCHNK